MSPDIHVANYNDNYIRSLPSPVIKYNYHTVTLLKWQIIDTAK